MANGTINRHFQDVRWAIKYMRKLWAGYGARVGENKNICRIFVGKPYKYTLENLAVNGNLN